MYNVKRKHLDVEIIRLYNTGKSAYEIARILGIGHSIADYRLRINGINLRTISEALVNKPKSETHRKSLSESRIKSGVAKGSKNPNWQGGKSTEYDKKMAALKRDPRYKLWAKAVKNVGYCKSCGSKNNLEAHHILPKSTYPHLIHDIDNGMCLCGSCHVNLHSLENGMNSGKLRKDNPEPSRVKTRKVQRLLETGTPVLMTSKSVPHVSDEIVHNCK